LTAPSSSFNAWFNASTTSLLPFMAAPPCMAESFAELHAGEPR
jgi:hypothetical protein